MSNHEALQASQNNAQTFPARRWKQFSAGTYDLMADEHGGGLPARKLVLKADGDFSRLVDVDGNDQPLTGLPDGFEHIGYTVAVTCSVAFIAYW